LRPTFVAPLVLRNSAIRSVSQFKLCFLRLSNGAQRVKACTHDIRQQFVVYIGNDGEQFLDTFTPDQCNNVALVTASQIASGSLRSFLCGLT
jgi:hypothetical protein